MIGQVIFIFFLAKVTIAAVPNPCGNRQGAHFAINQRGCSWYFVCDSDNKIVRENRCDGGFLFNYEKQSCDYRENVYCDIDDRLKNVTCPDQRGIINVIPHPYTCLKYTICFDGIENDRNCPVGKHFSYFENDCIDPFYADCSLDYQLCKVARETGLPTFVKNPRDCSNYFLCVGETAVLVFCPPKYHFVQEKGFCLPIEEANCESELPEDTPRIPDKVFTDECTGYEGNIPHPDACEFYFFCAGDRSYLQVCGEGLIFDVNSRRCEMADKAQCVLDIVTEPTTTEKEGSAEEGSDELFSSIIYEKFDGAQEDFDIYSPESEEFIPVQR